MRNSGVKTLGRPRLGFLEKFVEKSLAHLDPVIAEILNKALAEKEITYKEGVELMRATGLDLHFLILVADWTRFKRVGNLLTYVVNRNINFTNICVARCRFCAFSRPPNSADAFTLTEAEVAEKACEAARRGATEVCIQGGINPNLDPQYPERLLRAVKAAVPQIHIHAFSPMEIHHAAHRANLEVGEYLRLLKEAGLDSIPGTAAEILVDGVRREICPEKIDAKTWLHIVRAAHRLGIPTTATMMFGHVESLEEQVKHLLVLRDLQKETGGFTEFIPLPFLHHNTPLHQEGKGRPGPSGIEVLRLYATARILLSQWFKNIQVSWVKLGPQLAQAALNAGGNDLGGTLMEENISKAAGGTAGEYLSPEEFRRLAVEMGWTPAQRTTTYKLIRICDR